MREEGIFAALRRSIPKPKSREARKKALILAAMWRLADERVSAHRDPAKYQAHIWRLGCAINVNLKEDRHSFTEEAGEELERLLG